MKRLRAYNKFYRRYEVDLWGRIGFQSQNKTVKFLNKIQKERINFFSNPGRSFQVRHNKLGKSLLIKKLLSSKKNNLIQNAEKEKDNEKVKQNRIELRRENKIYNKDIRSIKKIEKEKNREKEKKKLIKKNRLNYVSTSTSISNVNNNEVPDNRLRILLARAIKLRAKKLRLQANNNKLNLNENNNFFINKNKNNREITREKKTERDFYLKKEEEKKSNKKNEIINQIKSKINKNYKNTNKYTKNNFSSSPFPNKNNNFNNKIKENKFLKNKNFNNFNKNAKVNSYGKKNVNSSFSPVSSNYQNRNRNKSFNNTNKENNINKNINNKEKRVQKRSKKKAFIYRIDYADPQRKRAKTSLARELFLIKTKLLKFYNNIKKDQIRRYANTKTFKLKFKVARGYTNRALLKYNSSNSLKKRLALNGFFSLVEHRLDILLFRSNLVSTIQQARQLINHRHVFVNENCITHSGHILKNFDLLSLSKRAELKMKNQLINNLKKKRITLYPPKYIYTDYRLMRATIISNPHVNNVPFPFKIDLRKWLGLAKYMF